MGTEVGGRGREALELVASPGTHDGVSVEAAEVHFERVAYVRTGEVVGPGDYTCTFCGHLMHLSRERALPLCGVCDTDEFTTRRPDTPTPPRIRQLVA